MAATTSAVTSTAPTTSNVFKRAVLPEDKIRHLWPARAKLQTLIADGQAKADGKMITKSGMISKKATFDPKFDNFYWIPPAISYTVSSHAVAGTVVLSAYEGLRANQLLYNINKDKMLRVASTPSSTSVTCTTVGVDGTGTILTTDAEADDVLLALSPVYEENSTGPVVLSKTDTNWTNYMQIGRYPIEMSRTAMQQKTYGGNYWERIKANNLIHTKRLIDNDLLFGDQGYTSGTTTTGGKTYRTTDGLWHLSNSSKDCGGALTASFLRKDVSNAVHNSVEAGKELIMFCGNELHAEMLEWPNESSYIKMEPGTHDIWGINVRKFLGANYTFVPVVHESFNYGTLRKTALIFDPEQLFYAHITGGDLHPVPNIQANDQDGRKDDLLAEFGLGTLDGGVSILKLTNCIAL